MTKILTIPPKLEVAIQKNNLVIFVGAGCSIPLGLPSWKKLIEDILQELDSKFGETSDTNFKNILNGVKTNSKSLFDALSKIENDSDNGSTFKIKSKEFINSLVEEISKNLPEESKVHSLLWEISSKIITTNYDKILQKYIPKHLDPKIFYNTNAFQGLKSQSDNSQFLYKIHGDYEDPETIILFESDYNDIYKNENYNTDTLTTHFKEKTFLFIGFSLTDPFVNDLFIKIKKIYKGYTVNEHFIFTTKNEDFIKYDVNPIKIDNWNDDLIEYLEELKKIKVQNESTIKKLIIVSEEEIKKDDELTKDDVNNIFEIITKKTSELLSNPGDKELATEVKDLRVKLDKLLYEKIDYLQEIDKPFRNNDLQILFDTIYSSEKLNTHTLEQIRKVRNSTDIYKWYDRSVIVSAITCSLIHFNKADEQKITLLIDFINDNEEKVWQKAITSLFMILNHLGNKWLRFDSLKTKIKSLNQNLRIQDSCASIIRLFSVGLNNISMVNEEIFDNPYFSNSPFNYFLPYYQEENPQFNLVYETYEGNDIENYIRFLDEVPLPDQLKYLLCSKETKKSVQENEEGEEEEDKIEKLNHILNYNSYFYPYSVFVQEVISFYKYFPVFKHEEKLKYQLKLTETPLKDYLLNEKEKHTALGIHFMQVENWSQAIVNYKEALKLDQNDISDLLNLANCYHNIKEFDEELNIRIKIQNEEPENESNLNQLFEIYYKVKKDFKTSLITANQLLSIDKKNADYWNLTAAAYDELDELDESLINYNKAIDLNSQKASFFFNRANLYSKLEEYQKSILDYNTAINLDLKKNSIYFYGRAAVFSLIKEYEKANNDLNISIKINNKDTNFLLSRSTNYLHLKMFDEALRDIKKAESLGCRKDFIFNYLSNYFRIQNDFIQALEYIQKAIDIEKDARHIGTKATIYASMGDDTNFYMYLEDALAKGAKSDLLFPDIKEKYKDKPQFQILLKKYKQTKNLYIQ